MEPGYNGLMGACDHREERVDMNENVFKRNELLAAKVIKGLQSRNMSGYYAASREEALARAAGCDGVLRANAAGCGRCLEGYSGRTGLFELLPCSDEVSVAIHDGRLSAADLRAAACGPGTDGGGGKARFRPMSEDASEKLRTRITTPAEVLAALGTF